MSYSPEKVFQYCPRCGSGMFHVKHSSCMSCRDCDFEYYFNAASAVCALIEDASQRLLLARRAKEPHKGTLDLPGGFVDRGETAEDALRREIHEELNLNVTEFEFFQTFPNQYLYEGIIYSTLDLAFICHVETFEKMNARDDVAGILFQDLSEIVIAEIGLASIQKVVAAYREFKSKDM